MLLHMSASHWMSLVGGDTATSTGLICSIAEISLVPQRGGCSDRKIPAENSWLFLHISSVARIPGESDQPWHMCDIFQAVLERLPRPSAVLREIASSPSTPTYLA